MERLLRRELSSQELGAVLRHVESCSDCASRGVSADAERVARALEASLDEPERHLDAGEEMIPYVDGTIDAAGREIVESHLEDCAMCRAEVEDLRQHAERSSGNRGMWAMFAIAAALAIGITALLLPRRDVAPPPLPGPIPSPPPRITTTTTTPTPAPPAPRYANPEWARLVDTMLETGRLPIARIASEAPDSLRGETTQAATLTPAGVSVESARPVFTWPASSGATFNVSIFSGDAEIATSGPLREHRWKPERALARGKTYVWQVEVQRDGTKTILPGPPAPPATFRVLSEAEQAELEAARAAHPDDALLLAALYARAGLEAEAKSELRKLEGSSDPKVKQLLRR